MSNELRLLSKGKQIARENARNYPVIAAGDLPEPDAAYLFESAEAFDEWVEGTRYADLCARV